TFPERNNLPKVAMPEVEVNWYDGGMMPDRPKGFPQGKELMGGDGGLTIFYGTKDTLVCSCYGAKPWLLSGHPLDAPMTERRLPLGPDGNPISHEMDWVRACKEDPANRVLPKSDFSQAGPFNEMVVMGVLAIRLQTLNRVLDWDGPNMRFTNINPEDKIRIVLKNNFHIVNGDPKFDKIYTDPVPAQEFAQELIKHTYRDGWTLPPMPA
ncbi:MAG: gfo/Idh/MocA family oxidoreductase, partial [Tannerella sp.]|nr:gfo/Idh/MocA family oxidoreductase [Tannerella sp.]